MGQINYCDWCETPFKDLFDGNRVTVKRAKTGIETTDEICRSCLGYFDRSTRHPARDAKSYYSKGRLIEEK